MRPRGGPGRAGAGREGAYGRGIESRWPKEGATETVQMGESYVVVFHEDPQPGAKVADPGKTPYSVLYSLTRAATLYHYRVLIRRCITCPKNDVQGLAGLVHKCCVCLPPMY